MRAHWNTWGECHRHRKGFGRETMGFRISVIFRIFGMDASRCTDELWQFFCACAVVFPPKYLSRWLWHHYMTSWGSLMLEWVGTIKGEHDRALGLLLLLSRCFDTSIWVFSKPQTLYFGCLSAPWVGSIARMHSVVCFAISMHPDLFGGLWVIVTSFIWWWPGRPLPSPLEPGMEWSTDHNPSVVNCKGGINC